MRKANARKTAQLMFENCSYNLALLNPDDHGREIHIPRPQARSTPTRFSRKMWLSVASTMTRVAATR